MGRAQGIVSAVAQQLTPDQRRTRERVEGVIRLMAPGLNLVLAAGERLSRIVEPEDAEYYPIRSSLTEGPRDPQGSRPQTS
jgi:hypothetical protein